MSLGEQPTMEQAGGSLVGKTIAGGKYEIVRLLGEGGMGAVYQARQIAMDRMVALKLIRPEVVTSRSAAARFHKEMLVTAKVEHPNTIRVYDFGEADGQLYLAMEFLDGASLRQVIDATGRLELKRIVRIGKQVANAIGAVHERGLVHRDLKPENVMLIESYGETDFVKVLDFGIAKSLDEDVHLTGTGRPIGTPAYMSPEQAMGQTVDHRSDLYALGVMLYRMASGRMPFNAPTAASMLLAHATEAPTPVLTLAPDTSPPLATLIMQLLHKDPAVRPATAAEIVARLDECLHVSAWQSWRPPGWQPPDAPPLGSLPTVAGKLSPATPTPTQRDPRRGTGRVVAIASALAVAAGATAYLVRRSTAGDADSHEGDVAPRKQLDDLLETSEPLAPPGCRASDPATVARLLDAARALADDRRDRALAILGDSPTDSTEAWALLSRAQLAGDAEKAATSAAEAARLCPGYAVAHNLAGNAWQKLGKAQFAQAAYARALTAAPTYDAPRFNLGLLQLRQNDAAAIATFTELLRRRPDHPNAHLARAQAYAMQSNAEAALADLDEALRRQPDSAEAWAVLGELRELFRRGDPNAAYCRAKQLGHARAAARCKD